MPPRSRRRLALGAAAILILGVVSCNKSPTSPSPGGQSGSFVSLRLVAPGEMAPGESVQLTANAVKSDGTVENVTSQAQWTAQSVPASSVVVSLTGTGLATGRDQGRAVVTLRFAGFTADATILVLPKGTFRLAGRITAEGVGLENVTLTVIAGVGQGLTALTDASGGYELYGVAGPVQVRASKDGYLDKAQQVDVTAHGSLAFELTAYRPSDNYTGDYTLILTASGCTPGFPEEAKRRVYTARVEQKGADLRVSLSGARFWAGSGAFTGVVTPTGEIRFTIRPEWFWDYDAEDLMEYLSDGDSLIVGGVVIARHTPAGISGKSEVSLYGGNGGYMRLNFGRGVCSIDPFELVPR
jgi:hypothetical protein